MYIIISKKIVSLRMASWSSVFSHRLYNRRFFSLNEKRIKETLYSKLIIISVTGVRIKCKPVHFWRNIGTCYRQASPLGMTHFHKDNVVDNNGKNINSCKCVHAIAKHWLNDDILCIFCLHLDTFLWPPWCFCIPGCFLLDGKIAKLFS